MANDLAQNTELLSKWVDLQSNEIKLQADRLRIEEQELHHNHEIAKITLDKQVSDRDAQRDFIRKCRKDTFLFISGIIAVVGSLIIAALLMDKDQIAMEIIKAVLFIISGGAGGYALGKSKKDSLDN
jgi:hypothetical protein